MFCGHHLLVWLCFKYPSKKARCQPAPGTVWGSGSCPRTFQHADQGNRMSDKTYNKTLALPLSHSQPHYHLSLWQLILNSRALTYIYLAWFRVSHNSHIIWDSMDLSETTKNWAWNLHLFLKKSEVRFKQPNFRMFTRLTEKFLLNLIMQGHYYQYNQSSRPKYAQLFG